MILVDAASAPDPALWQGLMLCALPILAVGMIYEHGYYFKYALGVYIALGIGLLVWIVN